MRSTEGGQGTARFNRRNLLKSTGLGLIGTTIGGSDLVAAANPDSKLVFNDQRSDGNTVVIAEMAVEIDRHLHIFDTDRNLLNDPETIEGGTSVQDYEVSLTNPIGETQELIVSLVGGDEDIEDRALVTVGEDPSDYAGIPSPELIEANPEQGFNYPYYIYAPSKQVDADPVPVLVEPVNTGFPTDNFDRHLNAAKNTAEQGNGKRIAESLEAPFIVPVFPRPQSEPVDANHHVHALDRTTLAIEDGPLERIDRQLLRMVEDARKRLQDRDYPVADGIMLYGSSDAGTFVDRFAVLHPEEVTSVTAGAINAMPLLPLERADGHTLDYHIGIANLEELTGESFDLEALREVNQFLFMGELDAHDTFTYTDHWTDKAFQDIARDVYGRSMHRDRLPYARAVYEDLNAGAVFRMYEGVGHSPQPAIPDVIEFHKRSLAGDDIETLRDDFGGNVPDLGIHVVSRPDRPEVGEPVTFDASRSALWDDELTDFEWEFNGETKEGQVVTHSFEESGGHNLRVTATDSSGTTYQETNQVVVGYPNPDEIVGTEGGKFTISLNDQETDGRTVVFEKIATEVDAYLFIREKERGGEQLAGGPPHIRFEAGVGYTDYEVDLDTILEEDKELEAELVDLQSFRGLKGERTQDTAFITVANDVDPIEGVEPTLIAANPDAGFNYPYYLYAPDKVDHAAKPVLAEPVNTGAATDNFDRHLNAAKKRARQGVGWRIANSLEAPYIVPVFPRPQSEPVDDTHYIQMLDRDTLEITDGRLERVDRQLLRMVEDARNRLEDRSYPVGDGLMLNGFSASGNFVERFAAIHPEEVTSVTAGGVNGMPILPVEQADDHTLDYHLGIADLVALTGEPFDLEAFREVNQFLFMGEFDDSDTILFEDAWTDDELQETALSVYGKYMVQDRFPYSRSVYDDQDAGAVFRVYEDLGHNPRPVTPDIVDFHERSLAGDTLTDLRIQFGGNAPNKHAAVEYAPAEPLPGDQVAFDATKTELENSDPVNFEWEFEAGETANGSTAIHTFDGAGDYAITLTVTDDTGGTFQATEYITVTGRPGDKSAGKDSDSSPSATATTAESDGTDGGSSPTEPTSMAESDATEDPATTNATTANTPGFGFVETAVAAVAAISALLRYTGVDGEE